MLPDAILRLEACHLDDATAQITFLVTSTQAVVPCPLCTVTAERIHSRYERTRADLPWASYRVRLHLRVRKFFCPNAQCPHRLFTERLPGVVAPWARRTPRLAAWLIAIGLALGGRAGVRLSHRLRLTVSRHTLLRVIRRLPLPCDSPPRVLGVDDVAFRKRQTHGTVVIDLEHRRLVAVLPDREAETLAQWLREHPGVAIIARDRARAYADGARHGAPDATQVADRFHLLQNLVEALEQVFHAYRAALNAVKACPSRTAPWPPPSPRRRRPGSRARRQRQGRTRGGVRRAGEKAV